MALGERRADGDVEPGGRPDGRDARDVDLRPTGLGVRELAPGDDVDPPQTGSVREGRQISIRMVQSVGDSDTVLRSPFRVGWLRRAQPA